MFFFYIVLLKCNFYLFQFLSLWFPGFLSFWCFCFFTTFLPLVSFRPWNEETLSRAYEVLLDELELPPSAPGGKVEFRRSLTLSFLFKFNLEVLQKLRETVRGDNADPSFSNSSRLITTSCLQNVITHELPEEMPIEPLPREIQPGLQLFQVRELFLLNSYSWEYQPDGFLLFLSMCPRTKATRTLLDVPSCTARLSARLQARRCTVMISPRWTASSSWCWSPAPEHTLRSRG